MRSVEIGGMTVEEDDEKTRGIDYDRAFMYMLQLQQSYRSDQRG